jgi:hypothetical protein
MRPPLAASAGRGWLNSRPPTRTGTTNKLAMRRSNRADIAIRQEVEEI